METEPWREQNPAGLEHEMGGGEKVLWDDDHNSAL